MDVNKILGIIHNHDGDAVELAKSLGGALEMRRAQTAKKRAGGQQLPPSKFMPNVPRQVHADGGWVEHYEFGGTVEAPQKTVKAYKLFRKKGDNIYPLFVDANTPVPMNQWIAAKAGDPGKDPKKVKSKLGDLAYRPGWHAGDLPIATHIGGKSNPKLKKPDYRPDEQVWAEVEMPNDVDWQSVANERAQKDKSGNIKPVTAHITDQVPHGGHYRYKTNPNMTGNWLIGGSMKVNRILDDEEVRAINSANGVADLPRLKNMRDGGSVYHMAEGGEIAAPPAAMHEPHRRAEEQGYSIKGYHVTRGTRAGAISSAKRFDPSRAQMPGEEATFFWDNPEAANKWAHYTAGTSTFEPSEMSERQMDRAERHQTAVMPVRIDPGKHLVIDWPQETGQDEYSNKHMSKIITDARSKGYDTVRIKNMVEQGPLTVEEFEKGMATGYYPQPHDQIAVLNPAMIRSEFAEFDPEKKGRDDIGAAHGGAIDHMAAGGFEDEPAPAMGHNNPPTESIGGLSFSPEEANARLTTRLNRIQKAASGRNVAGDPMNERTVVRAPEGSGLPDFVAGKLTFDDWKNRHQALSNADEMKEYASWYQNILGEFQKYYPDENEARSKMRAWLVAQQNVSPAGAMNNVLLQNEQIRRGVPEEEMKAAGMPNPTMAARAVLKGDPIRGGVGQKIADFVDAAEGKNVRSWMNNDERGGSPFVVDVHTARDTGMVDQELINHLTRLGYNSEDLAKLRIDLTGTPTEAAYENRGDWGRALTRHLNETNWMGRNDWTPSEIQAIGWMGMTKLTRNAEEDSESGLARNYRRISYEIAPGEQSPWEAKYGSALNALPEHEKYNITKTVSEHAMDLASQLAGIDTHNLVHGTGAWEKYQNPASVGQALSTKNAADIAAHALGYLLNQTEVWHNTVKKMTSAPKGFAIDFIENGSRNLSDKDQLKDFWQTIMDADETGLIKGYQPITLPTGEVGIRALVDKGGVKTKEALEKALKEGGSLDKALKNLPFDVTSQGYEAEISKARNDWSKDKNGEAYLERLGEFLGRDPSATLNSARESVESILEQALDEAHKRNGTSWRETRGKKRGGSVGSIDISHALEIARRAGNNGDTILAHINPQEAALLKRMGGSGTINPKTGLPQFGVDDGPEAGSTGSAAGNSYGGGYSANGGQDSPSESSGGPGGTASWSGGGGGSGSGTTSSGNGNDGGNYLTGPRGVSGSSSSDGNNVGGIGIGSLAGFMRPEVPASFGYTDDGQAADSQLAKAFAASSAPFLAGMTGTQLAKDYIASATANSPLADPFVSTSNPERNRVIAPPESPTVRVPNDMTNKQIAAMFQTQPTTATTPATPVQSAAETMSDIMGTTPQGNYLFSGMDLSTQRVPNTYTVDPNSIVQQVRAEWPTATNLKYGASNAQNNAAMAKDIIGGLGGYGLKFSGNTLTGDINQPSVQDALKVAGVAQGSFKPVMQTNAETNWGAPANMASYAMTSPQPQGFGDVYGVSPASSQYEMPSRPVSQTPSTAYAQPQQQPQQTVRQNFEQAFADARRSGADTFYWTNPATGKMMLYTTQLARAAGGRTPDDRESMIRRALEVAFRYGS